MPLGQTLSFLEVSAVNLQQSTSALSQLMNDQYSGLIIRSAYTTEQMLSASQRMQSAEIQKLLESPNQGMFGGELKTLGAAATPTFTALNGPNEESYLASIEQAGQWQKLIFDDLDMNQSLADLFSQLYHHKPCHPAPFLNLQRENGPEKRSVTHWLPFNYRILPVGVQIYSHHDMHYRLPLYQNLPENYNRQILFSWFLTTQTAEQGGELIVYGLTSDDPNPPLLPTRFMDTEALEKNYHKATVSLDIGDLVIFNSGRYVHRVNRVEGNRPRITIGGFLTKDLAETQLVYWS